jgi:cyclophilin family peptidyl-prolyl cis-trans isomerase
MKLAQAGAFNGTIFHRIVKHGIVQGGDPLTRDPAKAKLFGTGGLGVLEAEISDEPHTRGAVSAVLQPGKPDSGGAQFFVFPSLDEGFGLPVLEAGASDAHPDEVGEHQAGQRGDAQEPHRGADVRDPGAPALDQPRHEKRQQDPQAGVVRIVAHIRLQKLGRTSEVACGRELAYLLELNQLMDGAAEESPPK